MASKAVELRAVDCQLVAVARRPDPAASAPTWCLGSGEAIVFSHLGGTGTPAQLSVCLSPQHPHHSAPRRAGGPGGDRLDRERAAPVRDVLAPAEYGDFDVSEMSLASLCIAADHGVRDWVALPLFTTRRFFHTGIVVGTA